MLYQQRDRIYHDMKNHIAVLSALMEDADPEPARQYISKIQKPIRELEQKRYTASRIVNIIMNDKVRRAEAAGISLHVKALECLRWDGMLWRIWTGVRFWLICWTMPLRRAKRSRRKSGG